MKIVLTGFMAAGKTTVGKKLAARKNFKFYDSDDLITEREGMSIEQIFELEGEEYFRKVEKEVIAELLNSKEDLVLAPGGGAVLNQEIRKMIINKSEAFCLDITAEAVLERNKESEIVRPLLEVDQPSAVVQSLLKERNSYYAEIPFHIDSEKYSAAEIVDLIISELPDQKLTIEIKNQDQSYPVIIDREFNKKSFAKITAKIKRRKVLLLADEKVVAEHAEPTINLLEKNAAELIKLELEAGEKIKDLKVLEQIYNLLYENNFSRSDYLIAFGGGTIGDLGGLAAATFLRGIKLIQMPTTLISQLDSSVGGKTAVNFKNTKNLIGSFYQAELVYYQLEWLKTLALEELKSGLGEVIKYAVLGGNPLFKILKESKDKFLNLDQDLMLEISKISLQMKDYYVSDDVKDQGLRKKLNLGHSFGHAVEAAEKFKYKHGEAVVMGIAFTAFLSNKIGKLNNESFQEIIELINIYDYQLFPSDKIEASELASYIAHDKKIADNKMWWVLINDIGDTYLSDKFDHNNIQEYMEEYLCKKWL
ncbi:3-dehydroquinate synthase [Halanaerobium congolense]|jgi:shikimate kinase/3-dehydroquinate synthase|uniref:Shikimate kinase n=1 Tax=Halanaerobium congolense TaxID=54121 RepID=A0A1G6HZS4_9FIRM|nr:3-dehydroquinate synthase [Halanaerobium congolense]KXS50479.1 MAG: shikimate kinase / 3-dehydroquinate synthase [Halanaerobium sp. T82-1]OEG62035.1 MAG: 3-dehydroquinate synthase [Halanaerobium sp. MDAL1]PTX17030.1 3-dehydroquinate synthase [Halanaerobium congolense]PXV65977.1 3-dehydroquinate synthase [Halanaerobium congolense]SDB99789.1 3-dehydroquinate synthase [Halanaerobium congolense]